MRITRLAGDSVFEPEELALLQEMLDQLCLIHGITRQSPEAEATAQSLIAQYRAGLRGIELLRVLAPK
ncbi:MAG: hypothetical protein E5Y30_11895 [Mesorhizobium sp.]|nr:MAG: hypothetical protein E5Y30_11895 [Mesorhizobium sp.]